jgi:hypothetical protein
VDIFEILTSVDPVADVVAFVVVDQRPDVDPRSDLLVLLAGFGPCLTLLLD